MVIRLKATTSTMTDAGLMARQGAPHGTWVVADQQTAGQGRHGRAWHSPVSGLYATAILRPGKPLPVLTLALGLAAAQAVQEIAAVVPDLRWPNDLMIGPRKLGGILTTTEGGAVLAGIGINLADTQYPDSAFVTADRDMLLDALRTQVEAFHSLPPADILRLFTQASSYVSGRRVHVENIGTGVTQGLDENGFLLLRTDEGEWKTVIAGGVRPAA
jgi:BirA family biotin operon repressor/biotin-[acetyl-CoA-carboxylase] ligase